VTVLGGWITCCGSPAVALDALRQHGPLPRCRLEALLGWDERTAKYAVRSLERHGLAKRADEATRRGGRGIATIWVAA
jgi:predicted transcriptional regulator